MASGCRGRDGVELLEIQHTPPHAPGPHGPCALQLRYAARPHPASPIVCYHLHTPSSRAIVTLTRATAVHTSGQKAGDGGGGGGRQLLGPAQGDV